MVLSKHQFSFTVTRISRLKLEMLILMFFKKYISCRCQINVILPAHLDNGKRIVEDKSFLKYIKDNVGTRVKSNDDVNRVKTSQKHPEDSSETREQQE